MARAGISTQAVIPDSEPEDMASSPAPRSRKAISPPSMTRQSSGTNGTGLTSLRSSPPSRTSQPAAQKPHHHDSRVTGLTAWLSGNGKSTTTQDNLSSSFPHQHSAGQTPKNQTPKKTEVTTGVLEAALKDFSSKIRDDHGKFSARLIHDTWKRDAPPQQLISKKDWFAGVKLDPVNPNDKSTEAMRIKTKQVGQGRGGKQEKRERFPVVCIKTNEEQLPRYACHHVHIRKNILSPNTPLTYVPHLRDLADNEEGVYRRWLENLEAMDKTSGFKTLSRHEKVDKTIQKERATTLLEYLEPWLIELGISEQCTKAALLRHEANQSDSVTPQQKSSIFNSYSDEPNTPRTAKIVQRFSDAFNRVFNDRQSQGIPVRLEDVLLLDKSADTIVDPKKMMKDTPSQTKKDTPSQAKTTQEDKSVESFLETYSLLGCLVCSGHSCEHGEYGVDNERKRFSVEVVGGLSRLVEQQLAERHKSINSRGDSPSGALEACGEECYLKGRPGTRSRPWNETEVMLLKSFYLNFHETSIPVQCATAVATGRSCWDVQRQMDKMMDLSLPEVIEPSLAPVKSLPWYDRHRKILIGDWQEQTKTHEHQRKDHFDPCHHDGPCDRNCPCVQNHIMCERFCGCTAETCANKFTGCACHKNGKSCMSKQKDRPCICVLLNRECDPALCGSCGADERALPDNADDEVLHTYGCQNCALQRGKSKAVVLGQSKIAGFGLFTTEDIGPDEFVIEYVGELISQDEGVRREARRGDVFDESSNSSYLFTLLEQEGIWVDAAIYGNLSRYINHQDSNCNVTPKILYVNGEYRIKFTSLREIKAGEELFFNYGENFPNLTKKLLQEEKAEKKRRKAKEQASTSENGVKIKKKPGRKPGTGKKPGRKPGRKPKKTFAAVESEWEVDDVNDEPVNDPFVAIDQPRARKRRRGLNESDSGDWRPDLAESQDDTQSGTAPPAPRSDSQSRPASSGRTKRKRLPNGTFAASRYETDREGEDTDFPTAPAAKKARAVVTQTSTKTTTVPLKDAPAPNPTTPKRRGRKPKNSSIIIKQEETTPVGMQHVPPHNGPSSAQAYTHTEARLELFDEDPPQVAETPSRLRTRRANPQLIESSPLSTPGDSGAEPSDSDVPQPRKRGRKKKIRTADEEYDGNSWTDSNGAVHLGAQEESDDDDTIDRRRKTRRPARYEG
ncbi:hypothetical protein F4808DRAFT_436083 [Astrocystis sublimbata]|nr:hypothetical protein F4808DRAFT_436083 [Astrocystis sublimbata]